MNIEKLKKLSDCEVALVLTKFFHEPKNSIVDEYLYVKKYRDIADCQSLLGLEMDSWKEIGPISYEKIISDVKFGQGIEKMKQLAQELDLDDYKNESKVRKINILRSKLSMLKTVREYFEELVDEILNKRQNAHLPLMGYFDCTKIINTNKYFAIQHPKTYMIDAGEQKLKIVFDCENLEDVKRMKKLRTVEDDVARETVLKPNKEID